jgi:aminoglycoside 2'-N-acetyltransferase I
MLPDTKLTVIDEAQMPAGLDERIRAALCTCFPADRAGFSRTRAWHGSPPLYSVVLEGAGRVLAHAGIVQRTITVDGAPLRVAGVQNVLVLPERRGQGLSGRVLQAAMDEARGRGFDCGLLFCVPALGPLYAGGGWQALGPRDIVRVEEGRRLPLPRENVALFYPLRVAVFPDGPIDLCGNDW